MSPRTRRLSSKEMIRLLQSEGFTVIHTRGSHCKLRKGERTVIAPLNRDPLRIGTQTDILVKVGDLSLTKPGSGQRDREAASRSG